MSAEPRPSDEYRLAQLEESVHQANATRQPEEGDPQAALAALQAVAALDTEAADRRAEAFWLGPVALLEAVVDWDYLADLRLRADPEAWALLAWLALMAQRRLGDAIDAIARELVAVLAPSAEPYYFGEESPPFLLHVGKDRKAWHDDDLRRDVIQAFAREKVAGCATCGAALPVPSIEAVLAAWAEVHASTGKWKTGRRPREGAEATSGLRKLGIDPDEHCSWTPSPPTIEFVGVPKRRQRKRTDEMDLTVERRGPVVPGIVDEAVAEG